MHLLNPLAGRAAGLHIFEETAWFPPYSKQGTQTRRTLYSSLRSELSGSTVA